MNVNEAVEALLGMNSQIINNSSATSSSSTMDESNNNSNRPSDKKRKASNSVDEQRRTEQTSTTPMISNSTTSSTAHNDSPLSNNNNGKTPIKRRRKKKKPLERPKFPVQPRIIQVCKVPRTHVDHSYRDMSLVPPENGYIIPTNINNMTFSQKLHELLSRSDTSDCIDWVAHGRAFRILVPKFLEKRNLLHHYFGHSRYSTFLSQLKHYGLKQFTQGPDKGCYYHEFMLRGLPHLCKYMPEYREGRKLLADPENEPDLMTVSTLWPLPNVKKPPDATTATVDTTMAAMNNNNLFQGSIISQQQQQNGNSASIHHVAEAPPPPSFPNVLNSPDCQGKFNIPKNDSVASRLVNSSPNNIEKNVVFDKAQDTTKSLQIDILSKLIGSLNSCTNNNASKQQSETNNDTAKLLVVQEQPQSVSQIDVLEARFRSMVKEREENDKKMEAIASLLLQKKAEAQNNNIAASSVFQGITTTTQDNKQPSSDASALLASLLEQKTAASTITERNNEGLQGQQTIFDTTTSSRQSQNQTNYQSMINSFQGRNNNNSDQATQLSASVKTGNDAIEVIANQLLRSSQPQQPPQQQAQPSQQQQQMQQQLGDQRSNTELALKLLQALPQRQNSTKAQNGLLTSIGGRTSNNNTNNQQEQQTPSSILPQGQSQQQATQENNTAALIAALLNRHTPTG